MSPITARIPIFVTQAGHRLQLGANGTSAATVTFTVDPDRPDLLSITCPWFTLRLDREGVEQGLTGAWSSEDGHVTVSPHASWLVIGLDVAPHPAAQVSAQLAPVADFLAMAGALLGFTTDRLDDELAAWIGAVETDRSPNGGTS